MPVERITLRGVIVGWACRCTMWTRLISDWYVTLSVWDRQRMMMWDLGWGSGSGGIYGGERSAASGQGQIMVWLRMNVGRAAYVGAEYPPWGNRGCTIVWSQGKGGPGGICAIGV